MNSSGMNIWYAHNQWAYMLYKNKGRPIRVDEFGGGIIILLENGDFGLAKMLLNLLEVTWL